MDAMNDAQAPLDTTGYARLSRRQARGVLAVILLAAGFGVGVTLSPNGHATNFSSHPDKPSDVDLYRAEVERIHRGEGYYEGPPGPN